MITISFFFVVVDRIVLFYIEEKTFNRYDVAAAFCMSTGLIFFTLADSKVRPNFNLYGREFFFVFRIERIFRINRFSQV